MTKKEKFIEMVEKLLNSNEDKSIEDAEAIAYFETFKAIKESVKPQFTENGIKILSYMKENKDTYNNIFKAKEIGEGLFTSSKTVSGGLRKLVTDNYVEKVGENPTVYSLTNKGIEVNLSVEES
jgi:DNA-binding MarR family transcriptional regulator